MILWDRLFPPNSADSDHPGGIVFTPCPKCGSGWAFAHIYGCPVPPRGEPLRLIPVDTQVET